MISLNPLRRAGVVIAAAGLTMAAQVPAAAAPQDQPAAARPARAPDLPPGPPVVTAANADPNNPAFGDLVDAIKEVADKDATLDAMSDTIAREYAKVPEIAALEEAKPGLIDEVVRAMRPVLTTYADRVQQDYRPRMQAVFASQLSPAEAMDLAAFYRSPLGRKLMGSASRNMTMENTLSSVSESIAEGKDPANVTIGRAQVEKDITSAATSAVGTLTSDELAELGRLAREKPVLLKMNALLGEIVVLRTAMENEQPTAEENAALEQAVIGAMTRHLGQ